MSQSKDKKKQHTENTDAENESMSDTQPVKKSRGKRWLKRFCWLLIILGVLGYFINGPIARKLVHYYLNQALEDQGMTGSVEIKGSIISGFEANDLNYTGEQGIQILSVDHTKISYRLLELIDYKVEGIELDQIQAQIDIAKFQASEPKAEEETDWKQTLSDLRPIILQPDISIKNLDVTLLNDGEKMGHWKLNSLQHDTGTDQFTLNQWIATDGADLSTPEQTATLTWIENGVKFDRLEVIPNLTLVELQFDWQSELSGKSTVKFHDAVIEASVSETATVKLSSGNIKSDKVLSTLKAFGIEIAKEDLDIRLTALHASIPIADFEKPLAEWKMDGALTLEYNDAVIEASVAETATVKLVSGNIESDKVFQTLKAFEIDVAQDDIDANLKALEISIPVADFQKPVPLWDINGALTFESGRYQDYRLTDTTISIHQQDAKYKIALKGNALNAPADIKLDGTWDATEDDTWWDDTSVKAMVDITASDELLALIPDTVTIPKEIKLSNAKLQGSIITQLNDAKITDARGEVNLSGLNVDDIPIPPLDFNATWEKDTTDTVRFILKSQESNGGTAALNVYGNYYFEQQKYSATFRALTDIEKAPWLNALANAYESPVILEDKLDIEWNGTGYLAKDEHSGKLVSKNLKLKQGDQSSITLNLDADYDWPKSLDISKLTAEQEDLFASASLSWDGKLVTIRESQLKRDGRPIGTIKGNLPYSPDITTAKAYFAQQQPWELTIDTEKLFLEKIATLLPSEKVKDLKGTLQTNIKLTGSPKKPALNGVIDLDKVNDIFDLGLGDISLNAKMKTENDLLKVNGDILESGEKRVALNLDLPFTPHQWLEDDNFLATIQKNSQLKGTAEIKRLSLGKFKKLIPDIEKLEGLFDAKAEFNGTIDDPKYSISFKADLPIISIKNAGIDDIQDVQIQGSLDEKMILDGDLKAKINGGKFVTKYKVDVTKPDLPVFDVNLVTDHALIYRNDIVAARTNANISLKGTLEDAVITGNIGIVESLLYKDIDLIPIGVPSSAVGAVKLPAMSSKASQKLPIPAPFDKWKLNLTLKTEDPILIRGNVGNGRIQGSLKVGGTLAEPHLDGTLYANKVKAKLPFSVLTVDNGKIIFKPSRGLIPNLEIKGKSQVGVHNVSIYAYGSADNPKLVLSSLPALPENEIMTLLATGTTNAGLANRDVATFKTLQIILLELKQKHDRPGGNKLFRRVLSGIEDLDLKVGETNDLTGDKYASASFKLHERWYLTAQLDNNQPPQTRGLIVFALRFN